MKKISLILMVVLLSVAGLFIGCELQIEDPYVIEAVESINVGLGGENLLKVTSVVVDGKTVLSTPTDVQPSAWNTISEFLTYKVKTDGYVEYTFTQPTQGAEAFQTWALAVFDDNNNGNFIRGDFWLNKSTDATFTTGLWGNGGASSNPVVEAGFTYQNVGQLLEPDAEVVVKVTYDGENIIVTQTIDGVLAQTINSANF